MGDKLSDEKKGQEIKALKNVIGYLIGYKPLNEGVTEVPVDFDGVGSYIIEKNDDEIKLIVPFGIEKLTNRDFMDTKKLDSVVLPNDITEIGEKVFDHSGISNINLPKGLKFIGHHAFNRCTNLQSITIPGTVEIVPECVFFDCNNLENVVLEEGIKEIKRDAFFWCKSLENIQLPNSLEKIQSSAFTGCRNLTTITLPPNVKIEIDRDEENNVVEIFDTCSSLKTVIVNGIEIKLTMLLRYNFAQSYDFIDYATKNNKFLPKSIGVLTKTNPNEIENYYKHANDWRDVLNAYLNKWKGHDHLESEAMKEHIIGNLYQASVALGLFQDGVTGITAKQFIMDVILNMNPQKIHNKFGSLDTKKYGFNEEFAKFYISNYYPESEDKVEFLLKYNHLSVYDYPLDYTAKAYNNWKTIKNAYPNKTVLAHRERGSANNNLTEKDVFNALEMTYYKNVEKDNEIMAEVVGKYGYSQLGFDDLQEMYNTAKSISPEQMVLRAGIDTETTGVTFELMKNYTQEELLLDENKKDLAERLILGEKTNCCQVVNDAGKECLAYGMCKRNSGFIKFSIDGKIVGQSWVWYNEKNGIVCLDNVEIPTVWQKHFNKKENVESFLKCIYRLASSFKEEMEKNGHQVKYVTIGEGYNDLPGIEHFKKVKASRALLPKDYKGYSDATEYQYIIPIREKTIKKDEEIIK